MTKAVNVIADETIIRLVVALLRQRMSSKMAIQTQSVEVTFPIQQCR
ncbi:hypothetical protein O9929_05765 [Vibrio lentus]|nr:hypothetical protein [Vibrio lentus]